MMRSKAMVLALALLAPLSGAASAPVVEYYHAGLDHYFITWVPDEIAKLDAGTVIKGWVRTGQQFRTYTSAQGGASPVCRFYIPPGLGDSHFFGRGTAECVATGQNNPSFTLEDPKFMYLFLPANGTCPSGTTNVYRVFSNRADANHRYMTDKAIRDQMVAKGWLAEGDGPDLVVMCAPADTGARADFNPAANTTVGGAMNVASVTIPAGITVTLGSDLYLDASGAITVAGNVVGDCKALALSAAGTLNVSGSVDTQCTTLPAGTPPATTLVGKGGYHFTGGGTVTSSGDVMVTNNLAKATSATFDATGAVVPSAPTAASLVAEPAPYACESINRIWLTRPVRMDPGTNGGPVGQPGAPARTWTLWCDEGANGLIDRTTVWGQDGGHGGDAEHEVAAAAKATGGAGGRGGNLLVYVTGSLDLGANNTFNGGDGGRGGKAKATSTTNATGAAAPPATAISGKGGDAGLITVQADQAIAISGSLTLNVGKGGSTGNATAVAADGVNSTAARDAQVGGAAGAFSGEGGKLPRSQLRAGGSVTGLGNVTVTGGPGGTSGVADAQAGKGGDGADVGHKDGAAGGAVAAVSGRGGDVETRDLQGNLVGAGGDTSDAILRRALGGVGYNDCAVPLTAGGKGGQGGAGTGGAGSGGTGRPNGAAGTTREIVVGNGGNGAHGLGPGQGGDAGAAVIVPAGPVVVTAPVFTPGARGRGCRFVVAIVVFNDPTPPHEGFVGYTTITILDALVDNAAGTIAFTGAPGGKWIAVSGPFNKTTGAFSAQGTGVAAGVPGVPATFTGTITFGTGQIAGQITLGGGAVGLPQHSVSYNLTGNVQGVAP